MFDEIKPLEWKNEELHLLDQRILPHKEEYVVVHNIEECHMAIKNMVVRGAPLIGFTALWGMILWLKNNPNGRIDAFVEAGDFLKTARPTAVNLEYEVDKIISMAREYIPKKGDVCDFYREMIDFSHNAMKELGEMNLLMAKIAYKDLEEKFGDRPLRIMTLCNTGVLACGPLGTALGVISYMASIGKIERVYASETRPYMQGIRLTSYELMKKRIPHDIVVEGAASYLLDNGLVDAIFIGADRIVANGDAANKVGSSSLSIIAKNYGIPFYVVAPTSSFDLTKSSGDEIEIELRNEDEILFCQNLRIAPMGATALNPSFDITRSGFIEGIVCEKGLISPVNTGNLLAVVKGH